MPTPLLSRGSVAAGRAATTTVDGGKGIAVRFPLRRPISMLVVTDTNTLSASFAMSECVSPVEKWGVASGTALSKEAVCETRGVSGCAVGEFRENTQVGDVYYVRQCDPRSERSSCMSAEALPCHRMKSKPSL